MQQLQTKVPIVVRPQEKHQKNLQVEKVSLEALADLHQEVVVDFLVVKKW